MRVGVGHEERREPASLVGQARPSRCRQPHDRLDRDPCRAPLARELPSSRDEPVHQERGEVAEDVGVESPARFRADHACPLLVAEQRVVVLRQEPHRRRRVGVGQRRVGHVEQLPPGFVAIRAEARPEALDDLLELRQPAPRLDVHDGGGAVPREVSHDQVVDRGLRVERAAEPGLGGGPRGLSALSPDAARRHLDHRQEVADRGQRVAVVVRPALGEQRPKLGARPRPFLDEDAHHRDERIGVHALDRAAERTARPEHPLDDGLHERTQRRHVARRHQMDRGAHQRCPDRLPAHEQVGQLRWVEACPHATRGRCTDPSAPVPASR